MDLVLMDGPCPPLNSEHEKVVSSHGARLPSPFSILCGVLLQSWPLKKSTGRWLLAVLSHANPLLTDCCICPRDGDGASLLLPPRPWPTISMPVSLRYYLGLLS
jgi:hypothetical protein